MAENRQARIDKIVAQKRKAGMSRAVALDQAMRQVARKGAGTTSTPIYDKAVANAKKKGTKIPTLANQ
tara:strand:- start:212 stop:415 length:204 start_codon:yes stop_codon:yes gene_type:complete